MYLSKKFLYSIAVLLSAIVYHSVFAQMPAREVALSLTGPATVDERIVVSSVLDESKLQADGTYPRNALTNVFADGFVEFSVSLSTPLEAGERVEVPLKIVDISLSNFKGITTAMAVSPGISVKGADFTTAVIVVFEGVGAQEAALRLIVRDDDDLGDKSGGIVLGNLGNALSANPAADRINFTIKDDEYTFCFNQVTYDLVEGGTKKPLSEFTGLFESGDPFDLALEAGIATTTVVFARGSVPRVGLQHGVMVAFRYIPLTTISSQDTTDKNLIDYLPAYQFPGYTYIPPNTSEYVLEFPIIDDAEIEPTELIRIAAIPPSLPWGHIRCTSDPIIHDDDPTLSISADSDTVLEGDTVAFTITSNRPEALSVNLRISSEIVGDNVVSQRDETVFMTTNTNVNVINYDAIRFATTNTVSVSYNAPFIADSIGTDGLLSVEIVDNEPTYYTRKETRIASLTVLNVMEVSVTATTPSVRAGDAAEFAVIREEIASQPLTVNLNIAEAGDGNFVSAANEGNSTVTIPAGEDRATFTVPTRAFSNNCDFRDGRIVMTIASPTDVGDYRIGTAATASLGVSGSGVGIFADCPDTSIRIAVTTPTAVAGDAVSFLVSRGVSPSQRLTVKVDISEFGDNGFVSGDGTGTRSVTIPALQAWVRLTVPTADTFGECDFRSGRIVATLSPPRRSDSYRVNSAAAAAAYDVFSGSDEACPEVSVAVATTATIMPGNAIPFTVTRRTVSSQPLTVNLDVSEVAGTDFVAADDEGNITVTIPADEDRASFTVATASSDGICDFRGGRVVVAIAAPTEGGNYRASSAASAAVDISTGSSGNPADCPDLRLNVGQKEILAEEGVQTFILSGSGGIRPSQPLEVDINVAEIGGNGFVSAGSIGDRTVTFNANTLTNTFSVGSIRRRFSKCDFRSGRIVVSFNPVTKDSGYRVASPSTASIVVFNSREEECPEISVTGGITDGPVGEDGSVSKLAQFRVRKNPVRIPPSVLVAKVSVMEIGGNGFVENIAKDNVIAPVFGDNLPINFPISASFGRCDFREGYLVMSINPSENDDYRVGSPSTATIYISNANDDIDEDDDGLVEVCNLEQLDAIRYQLDGSGRRENAMSPLITKGCGGGDNGEKCIGYELGGDLDFNDPTSYASGRINPAWTEGSGWQPIGNAVEGFGAQFEGNGYAIVNLMVNRPQGDAALFAAAAESATIGGILLSQVDVNGKSNVGSLVGINEGIVANIDVLGGRVVGRGDDVGGLIGINRGSVLNNNIILERLVGGGVQLRCSQNPETAVCVADDTEIEMVVSAGNRVGGLIGYNRGEVTDNFVGVSVLGGSRVGGLIGFNSVVALSGNEASGNIVGNDYVGGMVGYSTGPITNSNSSGEVVGRGSYVGGLVGYTCPLRRDSEECQPSADDTDSDISDLHITGSSSSADVSGNLYVGGLVGYNLSVLLEDNEAGGDIVGNDYVGGLAGYSNAIIVGSDSRGEVVGDSYVGGLVGFYEGPLIGTGRAGNTARNVGSFGLVKGDTYIGGLVGVLGSFAGSSDSVILDSHSEVTVVANSHVGGLVGLGNPGSGVEISSAIGSVHGTSDNVGGLIGRADNMAFIGYNHTANSVTGAADHVGGMVGYNDNTNIAHSYATGAVEGNDRVGGLVGFNDDGDITNSHATGFVAGNDRVGGLVGYNDGSDIADSYAGGFVQGRISVGGLVGRHEAAAVVRSYAMGTVGGDERDVGGLVGYAYDGEFRDSYARGAVHSDGNNVGGLIGRADLSGIDRSFAINATVRGADRVGGLVGYRIENLNVAGITDSYARSSVAGNNRVGGLIGDNTGQVVRSYAAGSVTAAGEYGGGLIGWNYANRTRVVTGGWVQNSYWDSSVAAIATSDGGIGFADLKQATAPSSTPTDVYYRWREADWDFGTAAQYPTLIYDGDDDGLFAPQGALIRALTVAPGTLAPVAFNDNVHDYYVSVDDSNEDITISVIADTAAARVSVVKDDDPAVYIGGNDSVTVTLNAGSIPTFITVANIYRIKVIRPLSVAASITDAQGNAVGAGGRVDEGSVIRLRVAAGDVSPRTLSYEWRQTFPEDRPLRPGIGEGLRGRFAGTAELSINVPKDFVGSGREQRIRLQVEVDDGDTPVVKQLPEFSIVKVSDGASAVALSDPEFIGISRVLHIPNLDEVIAADPDGVAAAGNRNLNYQWQQKPTTDATDWADIAAATDASYEVPTTPQPHTAYRVKVGYTDGQGYANAVATTATARPIVDADRDGLIDIYYLEDIDAIKYQPDGSGYRAVAGTATTETAADCPTYNPCLPSRNARITNGCPGDWCRGYELIRDLDFNNDASYRSIANKARWTVADYSGDTDRGWISEDVSRTLTSTFNGNGFTIANLQIYAPASRVHGLIEFLNTDAHITDVGLLNIRIVSLGNSGGLCAYNLGIVSNSYVTGTIEATGGSAEGILYGGGMLAALNEGTILNSRASGKISSQRAINVGGLVGLNHTGLIINSRAAAVVTVAGSAGGLVGQSNGRIINSYATGEVRTTGDRAGGLVGDNRGQIINSYAAADVFGANQVGGLIGTGGVVTDSYAVGAVNGSGREVGGLVGAANSAVDYSYWDTDTSDQNSSAGGLGQTTRQLQSGRAQSFDATAAYYNWRDDTWSFGTDTQYPILKYAQNPDVDGPRSCGEDLPACGSLISPELHLNRGLKSIKLAAGVTQATLSPPYDAHISGDYYGFVNSDLNTIRFIIATREPDATVSVYDSNGVAVDERLADGDVGSDIVLTAGENRFVVVVEGSLTSRRNLSLIYDEIEINDLEGLDAIRLDPNAKYRLTRDLDFRDGRSYRSGVVNRDWTVDDYDDDGDEGWQAIGGFGGVLDGDGYTISNLQINIAADASAGRQGLFSVIESGGMVRDLGLLNVYIEDEREISEPVGPIAAVNDGIVVGSYAVGEMKGANAFGGLVGESSGQIINSYATGIILATGVKDIISYGGGLVSLLYGSSLAYGNTIINSYAGGQINYIGRPRANFGGLVGFTSEELRLGYADIINSYTTNRLNSVRTPTVSNVGGIIGAVSTTKYNLRLTNTYTMGGIRVTEATQRGALTGSILASLFSANNYSISPVRGRHGIGPGTFIGAFVPDSNNNIIANYYGPPYGEFFTLVGFRHRDPESVIFSSRQTAATLRTAAAQTGDPDAPYYNWSNADWDFGGSDDYPILKYAQHPDADLRACDAVGLPDCATLISPEIRSGLTNLALADGARLSPPFLDAGENPNQIHFGNYVGTVEGVADGDNRIRLIPRLSAASTPSISFYVGAEKIPTGPRIGSSETSAPIALAKGVNRIVIRINTASPPQSYSYPLYLKFSRDVPSPAISPQLADVTEIDSLEDLNAVRDNLSGDYRLMRDLDFNVAASYADPTNMALWTVADDSNDSDVGWLPIGRVHNDNCGHADSACFVGTFDGNGHAIFNMQINSAADGHQGLFAAVGSGGVVQNLGMLNLKIDDNNAAASSRYIGGLVGFNDGSVIGSYVVGDLTGHRNIGGVVGVSRGQILNSHAICTISAASADSIAETIGGLVAFNRGGTVLGSYAVGEISGRGDVGGLVGVNFGPVLASYAIAALSGDTAVGGLVGRNSEGGDGRGSIADSYADGEINARATGTVGGLVGEHRGGHIADSYTISKINATDTASAGGLVGLVARDQGADIERSYADSDINPAVELAGEDVPGAGAVVHSATKTTVELLTEDGLGSTDTAYFKWDREIWDFGTTIQYPTLKYTQNPNGYGARACDAPGLPDCGDLISPQLRDGIKNITLADGAELSPPFGRQHTAGYFGEAVRVADNDAIRLMVTTARPTTIHVHIGTIKRTPDHSFAGGATSDAIALTNNARNRLWLEIKRAQGAVFYPLYIEFNRPDLAIPPDLADVIEINDLEGLDAIRNNLGGNYRLLRDLDFRDRASYRDPTNMALWTVDDYTDDSDVGWLPIGNLNGRFDCNDAEAVCFTGTFDGNGYTISNLQINRSPSIVGAGFAFVSLFAGVGDGAVVQNIGMIDVDIEVDTRGFFGHNSAGLVGVNHGTIIGSYAGGRLKGVRHKAGLVGINLGDYLK